MLKRFRTGTATSEEIAFLESYFDLFDSEDDLITAENETEYEGLKAVLKQKIDSAIAVPATPVKRMPVRRWAIAAAVAALIGTGGLFLLQQKSNPAKPATMAYATGAPTLRLADGTTIALDSTADGQIASQAGVIISKEEDGTLLYKTAPASAGNNQNQENTLSTPAGMKYKIMLPDGSAVWLNAASSLTYPAVFAAGNRTVKLQGEAFFDIAADPAKPFIVQAGNQSVQVLGTRFNVNAYPEDGEHKTTLLQGAVKVSQGNNAIIIQPGQQTICSNETAIRKVNADTEKETAWINNLFSFKNDNLPAVMRDIARWYNVSIRYNGNLPDERFFGEISRSSKLEDVLKILEINGLTFDIKEDVITVGYKH
ncbi:FecR family protein [Chitinophaga sp. sic0106]|uniref:FecR family protein n=1 Tax=Chitinophaga sp. sic0106 TaxID=2854785 RepID=UPI001C4765C1|nr:FecR family protein [Chitinophaga sp. sic0106]MBV7532078.1 FecR domain-containing protein [Chitinophaga sp. sic0106]